MNTETSQKMTYQEREALKGLLTNAHYRATPKAYK